jgi:hypothetical protein
MAERLFVGVLGNRNSGKTHTWKTLFGGTVRTGLRPRTLTLATNECVKVFLISGSNEERNQYAGDILDKQNCQIVLCSMQYTERVVGTINYAKERGFLIYVQWLNEGYSDSGEYFDRLGLINRILTLDSVVTKRSGKGNAVARVQELREFIYGWAKYRNLIYPC